MFKLLRTPCIKVPSKVLLAFLLASVACPSSSVSASSRLKRSLGCKRGIPISSSARPLFSPLGTHTVDREGVCKVLGIPPTVVTSAHRDTAINAVGMTVGLSVNGVKGVAIFLLATQKSMNRKNKRA